VAQAVEHLLCKLIALSSSPSSTKKRKYDVYTQWSITHPQRIKLKNQKTQLNLVILATSEAEIRNIEVRGQPEQIIQKTPSPK
jgi:hypothetical protein